jgi:aspartyl-tRNA(Asn)/glutamyl-tRNA(Gln) amidotransferase subunit A
MQENPLFYETIEAVSKRISDGYISPVEIVRDLIERIETLDSKLSSFTCRNPEAILEAQKAEEAFRLGKRAGPLHGVPISLKDLILTRDMPTTAGTRAPIEELATRRDAELVRNLRSAGAIIVGKNNLHEVAFGVTSENDRFGPVRNPWSLDCVAGGSSGGSAAAVAAGLCYGSVGTDTRGSIRIPSSCCGVTGLKPTYDRISTSGVIPLSWTLDHAGPIGRSVGDIEILLSAMLPAASGTEPVSPDSFGLPPLKIGICDYYFSALESSVERAVKEAMEFFKSKGLEFQDIRMTMLPDALEASDIISRSEAVTFHDPTLKSDPDSYGTVVRTRLSSGYALSALDLVRAQRVQRETSREFRQVFREVDCLLAPTLPAPAVKLGSSAVEIQHAEEPVVQCYVRLNAPQNVAGVPALTMPCGFSNEGLPIGLQLIADRNREDILITLGRLFQQETDWHRRRPPVG